MDTLYDDELAGNQNQRERFLTKEEAKLAIAGVDIYRIKTLMRHKTINMTMRYAHLSPDLSQGMEKIER